jgi:hypothetical protein
VTTDAGRAEHLGTILLCVRCAEPPEELGATEGTP